MKVRCIANSGKNLSPEQNARVNSPQYVRDYLQVGTIYNVYGFHLFNERLSYLVAGDSGHGKLPFWEPVEFFEIVDAQLPPEWYFKRSEEIVPKEVELNDPYSATWGYKELVCDYYHSDRLQERDEKALQTFYKRMFEIDEWERNREGKG